MAKPILFTDTETSGMALFKKPYTDPAQPWTVQLGAIVATSMDNILAEFNLIIQSDGRTIHPKAQAVHGIDITKAAEFGVEEPMAAGLFAQMVINSALIVCHNVSFDRIMVCKLLHDQGMESMANKLWEHDEFWYCTMHGTTELCQLPGRYGRYKWPKLVELHQFLFGERFEGAHDALADIKATMRCYFELEKRGLI